MQSNYIPWKGVFDMINQVDVFVFFEDVDFTRRDWRTRNKIKTPNGDIWLTIPVKKSPRGTKIYEIEIADETGWQENHYKTLVQYYKKAKSFESYSFLLEKIYKENTWKNLSDFNIYTTQLIATTLGIKTEFVNSKNLDAEGSKDSKLIEICKKLDANYYLSGPAAKSYIDNNKFKNEGIKLAYMNYKYPEYQQLYGEFNHYISVLDVLFNCGDDAKKMIFMNNADEVE